MLSSYKVLDEKQKGFLTKISESTNATVNLIDKMKKLQDIEAGKFELEKTDLPLKNLIEQMLFNLKAMADKHNVKIEFDSRVPQSNIRMDVNLLSGVFRKLINNAIEHVSDLEVDKEKVVKIDMYNENENVVVKINNKGEPIPQEKLELFFEKFNTDRTKKKEGTGLGTTYAHLVTKTHGGEIEVDSNEKDGTTVTVKFNTL